MTVTPEAAEPDPDGTPPDGAELLDLVHAYMGRFCALPSPEMHDATVLWIALTHMVEHCYSAPRLCIVSPEKRSGKTRLLDILNVLVRTPFYAFGASTAALFRKISQQPTTLLFDEVDTIFTMRGKDSDNEDIRALLNVGYKRGATIPRCVGPMHVVQEFSVYGSAALAGIGDMPDTVMDRAVVVRMRRRKVTETVEEFRDRIHEPAGHAIREELAAWALHVGKEVGDAYPDLPEGIADRAAEVWSPLIAVADAAGGSWPKRARVAAVAAVAAARETEPGIGNQLLASIRQAFSALGDPDRVASQELVAQLVGQPEQPWATIAYTGLDPARLASLLKSYQVSSRDMKIHGSTVKGYYRAAFQDAWERYLPPDPPAGATDATEATDLLF